MTLCFLQLTSTTLGKLGSGVTSENELIPSRDDNPGGVLSLEETQAIPVESCLRTVALG